MLRPALTLLLVFTALTGLAWPLTMTSLAQHVAPELANARGPGAVGQFFNDPRLFHGRPSALATPYDATNSTGSNQGPTSQAFLAAVQARVSAVRLENPTQTGPVPAELVTASASGLDPDLSPTAVLYQVPRVAAATGIPPSALEQLVAAHTQGRWLGVFGEPRVNLVRLNRAVLAHGAGP